MGYEEWAVINLQWLDSFQIVFEIHKFSSNSGTGKLNVYIHGVRHDHTVHNLTQWHVLAD